MVDGFDAFDHPGNIVKVIELIFECDGRPSNRCLHCPFSRILGSFSLGSSSRQLHCADSVSLVFKGTSSSASQCTTTFFTVICTNTQTHCDGFEHYYICR